MAVELQRRWTAKLRVLGAVELFGTVVPVLLIVMEVTGGRTPWFLPLWVLAFVAVRTAIATEWVRADDEGIAWRALFRSERIPWGAVDAITTGELGLWIGKHREVVDCLDVHATSGVVRHLRASVWCGDAARARFLLAAVDLMAQSEERLGPASRRTTARRRRGGQGPHALTLRRLLTGR